MSKAMAHVVRIIVVDEGDGDQRAKRLEQQPGPFE